MAIEVRRTDGTLQTQDKLKETWRTRIEQARNAQKPFIPIWLSNLAFAAGQHWLVWDPQSNGGRLRHVAEMDEMFRGRNLLTADRINEYRQAQLGELDSDDDRQQLLAAQQSDTAEESAKELNQAVAYGWEHEWDAESALSQMRQYVLDLGTAAIRCRRDPDHGKTVDHQPYDQQGKPVTPDTHPEDWQALTTQGSMADGSLPDMRPIKEGRTVWTPHTCFQILTPPGINHEARFPWEILVDTVPLDSLQAEYPDAVLSEDTDIASAMGLSTAQVVRDSRSQGASQNRLRGHCWRYTCFQRPNKQNPEGQVVIIASNQHVILDVQDHLDYQLPNGDWHTGVEYFHWWRLLDRFYSRAFIEPMKDPQREINMLKTFGSEIIARGGPKVFLREQDMLENPQGLPMETIRMKDNAQQPFFFQGIGPGPWMQTARAENESDIAHASTLSALKLGENPQNVDTYSQLALLNEQESGKRSVIRTAHVKSIGTLEELGVWDIRQYWPDEKLILVSGDEETISQQTFKKSTIPDFYMVKVAKGAPQPRSQAAELKKVDAIWASAEQSGLVQANAAAWVSWYVDSINAGVAQEIPEPQADSQTQMAEYENLLMREGEDVIPADYDLLPVHLPIHREAQDQARASGDMQLFLRIQNHIDLSVQVQQENAAKVAQSQQAPSPLAPPPNPIYAEPDFQRLAAGN